MASFKAHEYEGFLSPRGFWIVLRQQIGEPGWVVRIMNFATFRHTEYRYDDETHARQYADLWRF